MPSFDKNQLDQSIKKMAQTNPFNPYVYKTTSVALTQLARTNWQVLPSILDQIEKYGVVLPRADENDKLFVFSSFRGNKRFMPLTNVEAEPTKPFSLPKFIKNLWVRIGNWFKGIPFVRDILLKRSIKKELNLDKVNENSFNRVNLLLIYLVRAKQNGFDLSKYEKPLQEYLNAAQAFIQEFNKQEDKDGYLKCSKEFAILQVKALENRVSLIKKITQKDECPEIEFKPIEQELIDSPFPIMFLTQSYDKFEQAKNNDCGRRMLEPLKIGQDIKIIATDTQKHRFQIKKFLYEHNIKHIKVVYFSQLEKAKITLQEPQKPPFKLPPMRGFLAKICDFGVGLGILKFVFKLNWITSLIDTAATLVYGLAKELYLRCCMKKYNSKEKIASITNEDEKQALLAGVKSGTGGFLASWYHYFDSYYKCCTWKYPFAYSAGKGFGMHDNVILMKKIIKVCEHEGNHQTQENKSGLLVKIP